MTAVRMTPLPYLGKTEVTFAFDATVVAMIKETVPWYDRTWDPTRKVWTVADTWLRQLVVRLSLAGHSILTPEREPPPTPPVPEPRAASWADALFDAVGPDLVAPVHRALSRVLHPDAGGDTELMQALNAARDRRVTTYR